MLVDKKSGSCQLRKSTAVLCDAVVRQGTATQRKEWPLTGNGSI